MKCANKCLTYNECASFSFFLLAGQLISFQNVKKKIEVKRAGITLFSNLFNVNKIKKKNGNENQLIVIMAER